MKDVRDALIIGRTSDGRPVRRPLSPHLQVYRPQITSILSIMHRFTGIWLCAGALLLVAWLVGAATSPEAYAAVAGFIGSGIGLLLMFTWTVALWFHFFNGLRHLSWDAGFGLDLPEVHRTGRAVVIGTVLLTFITWIIAFVLR